MKNFENMVKKAIGFDENRGDQVEVTSMPFAWSALEEGPRTETGSAWKDYFQMAFKPLVSLVLALLFFFLVIKPMMKKNLFEGFRTAEPVLLDQLRPRPALPAGMEGGEVPQITQAEGAGSETGLQRGMDRKQIFHSVEQDPTKAAEIVKSWLHERE